jgi:hypothetical protein
MSAPNDPKRFPLLDSLLEARGLKREPIYTVRATAAIFDVSTRTIEDWCCEGKMVPRDLPGHGRFLNEDLEKFLQGSQGRRKKHKRDSAGGEEGEADQNNDDDSEDSDGPAPCARRR